MNKKHNENFQYPTTLENTEILLTPSVVRIKPHHPRHHFQNQNLVFRAESICTQQALSGYHVEWL